ncbi:MAG: hypothetical protein C5B48_09860 [Candidatus Rokuibacteriota bacterium]|nr:MAG: hypothetical protein C5B48_09860 [Candidatus Rokubacteria bacterium]
MPSSIRTRIVLAAPLALTALALCAGAVRATTGAAGWSRVSGPTQPGLQLGLARSADGVLHVIWNRGATPTSIIETRLSPAGRTVGTSTVATGFDGNGGLGLLVMPDRTLRLFAAGGTHPGSSAYGINTFTAPASGGTWSLQSGAYWGGALANSAALIGAALTGDGQPVTAWRGFAAEGVPGRVPQGYEADMTESQLATDAASGGVVLSGVTNAGKGGLYVQQVLPSQGAKVVLPLPYGQNDWYTSLSGRSAGPGVYVAYADSKAVRLYRYGGGTKTLARGDFTSAAACAGPDGRLWVGWGDKAGRLYVTRSNRAAAGHEPVQKLRLPVGNGGLTFLQCEGSAGPLDLFANVAGGAGGFWHTHVLARLSLHAQAAKSNVTISVRDAGDPVAGATVTVAGKRLRTGAAGQVSLTLRPGSYSAAAAEAGYAVASIRFTVR